MSLGFLGSPINEPLFAATPFSTAARTMNQRGAWATWGDNALPEIFAGLSSEVAAIREAAMLEDKSPLGKIHIHGTDAERFVDQLIPRDVTRMSSNHAYYTPWCDDRGKVILEGLLFKLSDADFIVTAGWMGQWLFEHLGRFDVQFEDVTDRFGILALQGPNSLAILEEATGRDWSDLRFSRGRQAELASATVHVWRTGFTGVRGYELWVPPKAGNDVWETLMSTPTGRTIQPCGHSSQDIVRVEAGMVLPAIDYARAGPDKAQAHGYGLVDDAYHASPFELNLGRFVDFGKAVFSGREALQAEIESQEVRRRMWAMHIDWRRFITLHLEQGEMPIVDGKIRRFPPLKLLCNDVASGFATSVGWSPTLREIIGFAHLPATRSPDDTVVLKWEDCRQEIDVPASLSSLPFVKPSRR